MGTAIGAIIGHLIEAVDEVVQCKGGCLNRRLIRMGGFGLMDGEGEGDLECVGVARGKGAVLAGVGVVGLGTTFVGLTSTVVGSRTIR